MFTKSNYLIKEHVTFIILIDTYDIFDPENGEKVAYAKEKISGGLKALRLLISKRILPTNIEIRSAKDESLWFTLKKPVSFFRSKVMVHDNAGALIGYFKSRILTIGGRFDVFTAGDTKLAEVKGNWTGWNFKFLDNEGRELGLVTKKWTGLGQELFTSADNYMVSVHESSAGKSEIITLLIIAGIAIDVVYKEKK